MVLFGENHVWKLHLCNHKMFELHHCCYIMNIVIFIHVKLKACFPKTMMKRVFEVSSIINNTIKGINGTIIFSFIKFLLKVQ